MVIGSDVEVRQFVTESVAIQSVAPPAAKVDRARGVGRQAACRQRVRRTELDARRAADSAKPALAFVMVTEVVAVCGAKLVSPEYDAVTASVPVGAVAAVQASAGSTALHSVVAPVVKTTVPTRSMEGGRIGHGLSVSPPTPAWTTR